MRCIVVGGDPRSPLLRCTRTHRRAWLYCARRRVVCIVVGETPEPFLSLSLSQTLSQTLSLSLLFEHLPAFRDIHEAPHYVHAIQNSPACDATHLRRLKSSRIALLFWVGWTAAWSAGVRPVECSALLNKRCSLVRTPAFVSRKPPLCRGQ
jgi:hypothetical protein